MEEAKTLVHMSISAILSSMILVAAIGLIGLGYVVWSYFSRQDAANQRMADYANYTAFDNTTVRGQEVIGLIESDLDLFIIFYDGASQSDRTIDNMSVSASPTYIYYSDTPGVSDFNFSSIQSTDNSINTCENALTRLKALNRTPDSVFTASSGKCLNGLSHSALISKFTDSMGGLGAKARDNSGQYIQTNSYAAFKSTLVYAEDGTTDIVGVILVRADENVASY